MLIHGEPAELQLAGLFGDSRNKFAWLTIEIQVRKDVPARSVPPRALMLLLKQSSHKW
jgi:hypothetical protein